MIHSLHILKLYILDKFERNEQLPVINKQFVTNIFNKCLNEINLI